MPQIIVFSDIHGNLPALQAIWRDISRRPYTALYCLGDLAAFGPWPNECIAFVRDVMKPTGIIAGNTDRYLVEQPWKKAGKSNDSMRSLSLCHAALSKESLAYLSDLPATFAEEQGDLAITLAHGVPGNDELGVGSETDPENLAAAFKDAGKGVTFCGHTHVPFRARVDDQMIVNVGSVGQSLDGDHRACYYRASVAGGAVRDSEFRRVSYPIDQVIERLIASEDPQAAVLLRRMRFAER